MDAVDLQVIQKFVEVPFAVEAPASAADHLARASAMLAGMRVRIDTDNMGDVPYRKALNDIRKQVETEFAYDAKRIEFFDLSEKQPVKEAIRIDLTMAKFADGLRPRAAREGAFTVETKDVFDEPLCVVVGPSPSMTAKQYFAGSADVPVSMSGVDDETMHRVAMWHELAHCMIGASENTADVFAALMEIRHSKNDKIVPTLAAWREFDEMTNPALTGDRAVSTTLWSLHKIEGKLRKGKKFMTMGAKEIAGLATEIVAEFGPGKEQRAHVKRFRAAMNGVAAMKAHYLPVDGGVKTVTLDEWIAARAKSVPEFKRFESVLKAIKGGAQPLEPQFVDVESFATTMKKLVADGDPTASAFLGFYEDPQRLRTVASAALDQRVGFRQEFVVRQIVQFDQKHERIGFSYDNDVWQITDAKTGDFVKSGSITLGCEWGIPADPEFDLDPSAVQMAALYSGLQR